jgi:transcriptional regulator with XRE-family HTH domain
MKTVNQAVRFYLKGHGIKQKDLAAACGYDEGPMSKMLSKPNWNMATVQRIMAGLDEVSERGATLIYDASVGWYVTPAK